MMSLGSANSNSGLLVGYAGDAVANLHHAEVEVTVRPDVRYEHHPGQEAYHRTPMWPSSDAQQRHLTDLDCFSAPVWRLRQSVLSVVGDGGCGGFGGRREGLGGVFRGDGCLAKRLWTSWSWRADGCWVVGWRVDVGEGGGV